LNSHLRHGLYLLKLRWYSLRRPVSPSSPWEAPRNSDPDNHNLPIYHNPSDPDPTPENDNNHRSMNNSHKDRGMSSRCYTQMI
jgi:hypothetical protein